MSVTVRTKPVEFPPTIGLEQYDVVNEKGQDIGQVQTFVVDMREGLIEFALVSFGRMLGFSDKWFAIPWTILKWHPETMRFILDMPEEILKVAPCMKKEKWWQRLNGSRKKMTWSCLTGITPTMSVNQVQ